MTRQCGIFALCIGLALAFAGAAQAQGSVRLDNIVVHGKSLEGNLEGNSPDRSVYVYLPPSYDSEPERRYPVVYGLHGYSINNEIWSREINAPASIDGAFAQGVGEMIVVLPSSQTLHNGSMYSSSVTIGDWESFIAGDLVAYVDAHYRTLPARASRGLVGHSMGGYGATRIGMKRPDVFGSLYIMSPCCMGARGAPPEEVLARLEALEDAQASTQLGFLDRATLAVAAAWSPNPEKPPLFADLPSGEMRENVLARWAANAPLAMAEQYIFAIRKYNGVAMDVGDRDGLRVDAAELHRIWNAHGVENSFEIYDGDHVSGVADRFENHVLPFFAARLSFE